MWRPFCAYDGLAIFDNDRIGTLERDHRTLLIAFGGAFVFIIVMFAAGYLSLSAKMDAGFDRIGTKIDTLASTVGEVRTDVAVLKTDVAARNPADMSPAR